MAEKRESGAQNPPATIWSQLDDWAHEFKPWQRFVLANAVRIGRLTDEQIDRAYQVFLQDHGLAEASDPPIEVLSAISGRPTEAVPMPIWLRRVGDLRAVNALPAGGELTFSPALTVVYGGNGVGKSGYTRILSNVCFSRAQHPILPNVYEDDAPGEPAAKIVVTDGTQRETVFEFDGSTEYSELRRIAVFDTAVARTHLVEQSPLGFKPAGFDVFPEMARVYTELGNRLAAEIERRDRENTLIHSFVAPESSVSKFVAGLDAETDLAELRLLAVFGETEAARLEEVQRQIKDLQSKSVAETVKQLQEAKRDVVGLQKHLLESSDLLTEDRRGVYRTQLATFREKARVMAAEGAGAFGRDIFKATGTTEWEQFLAAASALARQEREDYPQDDDHCLLCHRPLDAASVALIRRFWGFLASAARGDAEKAGARLDRSVRDLKELRLDFLSANTTVRAHLTRLDPALSKQAVEVVAAMDEDRSAIIAVLEAGDGEIPSPGFESVASELADLVAQIEADIRLLEEEKVEDAIKALEAERIALRHRQVLNQILPEAERYVSDQGWVRRASGEPRRTLNPLPITNKEKELFASIIAQDYKERFSDECRKLNCSLPVEFRTQGQRGQTLRSLTIKGRHRPDEILSEGEQRAVALADFLTEVSLNPANAGIVLDDPVTSQDHERKERIARRLVSEAKDRQVIIFTHDLVFLTMVAGASENQNVELLTHWIERDGHGNPGQISLDDCPATTPQYRNTQKARKTLAEAKEAAGSTRVKLVQRGMGELRRTIEEIVPHHLLKQVVNRWTDRIIVTGLKKVHWDEGLIADIIASYEELSAYIEGHSHTEARAGGQPEPNDLGDMIVRVDDLIKRARADRPRQ
ncbi:MAG: AAA family ATPase [Rhodospirillaceae bacterium]|nr:AAA family ATPase [Rhodospirillaceae bacterium]